MLFVCFVDFLKVSHIFRYCNNLTAPCFTVVIIMSILVIKLSYIKLMLSIFCDDFNTPLRSCGHTSVKNILNFERKHLKTITYALLRECVQVSLPTIGIEKSFEFHSKIRMHTIDVTISADRTIMREFIVSPYAQDHNRSLAGKFHKSYEN